MLKIDMPKPTNCGDCFLCRAGKCEKAYEAYLKMGSMFFNAVCEPDFMLDDCPIEEIDEAKLPKEGEWIWDKDGMDFNIGSWRCSRCQERPNTYWQGEKNINPLRFSGSRFCPNCGARMDGAE